LESATRYVEANAYGEDTLNGLLAVTIEGTVNMMGLSAVTYELTYTATDAANLSCDISRFVTVEDNFAPTITVYGNAVVQHEINTSYMDPGAIAVDTLDGNITVDIDGEDFPRSVIGTYTITYTATDVAGNKASKTRVVAVVLRLVHLVAAVVA
jgi:hypothetical protein